jgi:hypothetical protein
MPLQHSATMALAMKLAFDEVKATQAGSAIYEAGGRLPELY